MADSNTQPYYDTATMLMAKRLVGIGENGWGWGKCRKAEIMSFRLLKSLCNEIGCIAICKIPTSLPYGNPLK
jgi:hypothetical protein